jgi:hypothetical protein
MADKKTPAAEAAHEDVVYAPEAATPVAAVEGFDPTKLNTLAVVSLATAATGFGAVAGVVTGHFALAQIRRSGQKGRGLALAGLIAGYAGVAGAILIGALSVGGAVAHNRFDNDNRMFGGASNGQIQMQQGNGFGQRGLDDQGFGMMGGQTGTQSGQGQVVPNGQGQGGTVTLDSNGNPTITLPDGSTVTLPDGGMMGGKGFGPMGGNGGQTAPTPTAVPQSN